MACVVVNASRWLIWLIWLIWLTGDGGYPWPNCGLPRRVLGRLGPLGSTGV